MRGVIPVRAGLAKGGDRGHDQLGILLGQGLILQTKGGDLGGMIIMDHDIRVFDQSLEQLSTFCRLQVQRHPALIRIQIQKQPALFGMGGIPWIGSALPGKVATRFFDFDYLRAKVSHQLTRIRSRDHMTTFNHADTMQGAWGLGIRHGGRMFAHSVPISLQI